MLTALAIGDNRLECSRCVMIGVEEGITGQSFKIYYVDEFNRVFVVKSYYRYWFSFNIKQARRICKNIFLKRKVSFGRQEHFTLKYNKTHRWFILENLEDFDTLETMLELTN